MHILAVIVTHNRLNKLQISLQRILDQNITQVLIVNCGSTDNTKEYLLNLNNPKILSLHLENVGGAGGFYYGIEYALKHLTFDWVIMFDDDAYPEQHLLERFSKFDTQNIDLVASKVIDRNQELCQMNIPLTKYPTTILQVISYMLKKNSFRIHKQSSIKDIACGSFVGFFIKHDVIATTYHMIHPKLFIYFDDVYFTRYCTTQGYRYVYNPDLIFTHDTGLNHMTAWKLYLLARNQFIQREFYHSKLSFYFYMFCKTSFLILKTIRYRKREFFKALFKGVLDGYRNDYSNTQYSLKHPDIIKNIIDRIRR